MQERERGEIVENRRKCLRAWPIRPGALKGVRVKERERERESSKMSEDPADGRRLRKSSFRRVFSTTAAAYKGYIVPPGGSCTYGGAPP